MRWRLAAASLAAAILAAAFLAAASLAAASLAAARLALASLAAFSEDRKAMIGSNVGSAGERTQVRKRRREETHEAGRRRKRWRKAGRAGERISNDGRKVFAIFYFFCFFLRFGCLGSILGFFKIS